MKRFKFDRNSSPYSVSKEKRFSSLAQIDEFNDVEESKTLSNHHSMHSQKQKEAIILDSDFTTIDQSKRMSYMPKN